MADEYGKVPDLSALIGPLLSNPGALSMLTSLLGNMGQGGAQQKPQTCDEPHRSPPQLPCPPPDPRARLLDALRPFLSPTRCEMVNSILHILELMEMLKKRR